MNKSYDLTQCELICKVAKRLDLKGVVTAYEGNISLMKDGYLYITPTTTNKAFLEPEMICVFDPDGNQISGGKPTSELKAHRAIYKMRDNIGGVVHAHAPFLCAFAMCHQSVNSRAYVELMCDHKEVELIPFGLPGSEDMVAGAQAILDKGRNAMILANHGALTVGKDIIEAMNRMESVEAAAKIELFTRIIGQQVKLPDEVILKYLGHL